jgi:hypothetical protein
VSGGELVLRIGHGLRLSCAGRIALAVIMALALTSSGRAAADPLTEGGATEVAPPQHAWTLNLYDESAVRFQNPDSEACTAAATESMLNLAALAANPDMPPPRGGSLPSSSFVWSEDTSYETQESILTYERQNMTMVWTAPGSDPHGWRNALNYFGWGSMKAGVYRDSSYDSFDAAVRATIHSIARSNMPVGILGWAGGHAQYVTGYSVVGDDPRVGDHYTILGVYLTDPLAGDRAVNVFLSYDTWENGPGYLRFWQYWDETSPYLDPIDGNVGDSEWWGKWVIINPVV